MTGYSVEIKESSMELTAKDRIKMKDTSNATRLDLATEDGKIVIRPMGYAILAIHNEKSDNIDYDNYVIIDEAGDKYVTGSEAFWSTFMGIWNEMLSESDPWELEIYKLDSKNYKGKQFLTCSIL